MNATITLLLAFLTFSAILGAQDIKKDQPAAKPAAKAATVAQKTEGTFTGIEQGDYSHWQMKTKGGKEVSYFILKTDAALDKVIANSKAHIGKRCRVTWKKSTEDIPEAGGKMEIDVILQSSG